MSAQCVRCRRPMPDTAYVCAADARSLAEALTAAAGHAEDAWTVIARQARYGAGSRGGRDEPLPVDLTASAQLAAVENTIGTWARHVLEESRWQPVAGPRCPVGAQCSHGSCAEIRRPWPMANLGAAAGWLAAHVHWLRMRPEAAEAFGQLTDACTQLERLVDRPSSGHRLVGMCDCGKILYAPHGRDVVQCKACGAKWNVTESQGILLRHLDGKLVTVPEALDMAGWLDVDRTREQIRKLVTGWAKTGQIAAHGQVFRDPTEAEIRADPEAYPVAVPTYRFGEIRAKLAATPRRNREGVAA